MRLHLLAPLFTRSFPWARWENALRAGSITLDRPKDTVHPAYPDIRYPLNYGFLEATTSGDGDGVDVFVGTGATGLTGLVLTHDKRKDDREVKLLYNCTPVEIYTALGFLNYAPDLLVGRLATRYPMAEVWGMEVSG